MSDAFKNTDRPSELHHATPTFANLNKSTIILGQTVQAKGTAYYAHNPI
jgi:hypothetical protein